MAQRLIVEGKDGVFIANLLEKKGLHPPEGYSNPEKFKSEFIIPAGGYDKALLAFDIQLEDNDVTNLGLVIDANDKGAEARWQAIQAILEKKFPEIDWTDHPLRREGLIFRQENYPIVGVWVMPDNQNAGYLEHFIATLIPENDQLWSHAKEKVGELSSLQLQRFSQAKRQKAYLHTWLAWQQDPGLPFGVAVSAGHLGHSSTLVDSFSDWFQNCFELES